MTAVFDANSTTLPSFSPSLKRRYAVGEKNTNEFQVEWPTGTTMYRALPDWTRLLPPIFIPAPIQFAMSDTPIGTSVPSTVSTSHPETDYTWEDVVLEEMTDHDITLSCLEIMRHVTNMERVRIELNTLHTISSQQEKKRTNFAERLAEAKQLWESACAIENVPHVVLGTPEYERVLDRLRMWMAIKKVAE